MTLETQIEQIVADVLGRSGFPERRTLTNDPDCQTCGRLLEQNRDCYGQPNGYRMHDYGACLQHLREVAERYADKVAELSGWIDALAIRLERIEPID
jgi:hypothetical protein